MADTKVYRASTTAPVNIAVVKYVHKTPSHVPPPFLLPRLFHISL